MWIKSDTLAGALAAALFVLAPVAAQAASPIEGTWLTKEKAEISIKPCGDKFCGTLSWIVIPDANSAQCEADKEDFGSKMLDYQNPDPALRTRSLIGVQMMSIKDTGNGKRFEGELYNAEDGSTHNGIIELSGDNKIKLGGCLMGMCVMTEEWKRVPDRADTPGFVCSD